MATVLPSRGLYGLTGALLAGAICAALAAFAGQNVFGGILFMLSPLPIFLAGLGAGIVSATLAAGTACLVIAVTGNIDATLLEFAGTIPLPALLLSLLALRYRTDAEGNVYWYPMGRLLMATLLYPCVFYIGLASVNPEAFSIPSASIAEIQANVDTYVKENLDAELAASGKSAEEQQAAREQMTQVASQMTETIKRLNIIMPSALISGWALLMLFCLYVAQKALSNQGWALRPTPTWLDIELPQWLLGTVILAGLVAMLAPEQMAHIGLNLLMVFLIPYAVLGICVVHIWAGRRKSKTLLLVIFYLLLMFGWPMLPVIMLGIAEPFIALRKRIISTTQLV